MSDDRIRDDDIVMLTPLGAAIADALPDQSKVREIERKWKIERTCPTSSLFPTPYSVYAFYYNRGIEVEGN